MLISAVYKRTQIISVLTSSDSEDGQFPNVDRCGSWREDEVAIGFARKGYQVVRNSRRWSDISSVHVGMNLMTVNSFAECIVQIDDLRNDQ